MKQRYPARVEPGMLLFMVGAPGPPSLDCVSSSHKYLQQHARTNTASCIFVNAEPAKCWNVCKWSPPSCTYFPRLWPHITLCSLRGCLDKSEFLWICPWVIPVLVLLTKPSPPFPSFLLSLHTLWSSPVHSALSIYLASCCPPPPSSIFSSPSWRRSSGQLMTDNHPQFNRPVCLPFPVHAPLFVPHSSFFLPFPLFCDGDVFLPCGSGVIWTQS